MIRPGSASPLGVFHDGDGVNVAVAAPGAEAVDFCVFSDEGPAPGGETRFRLPERDGEIWHGHISGVRPGTRYGLRAHGPYAPERGHRFNPAKLLLDPYARLIRGTLAPNPAVVGFADGDPYGLAADDRDSAPYLPMGVVVGPVDDDNTPSRTPTIDPTVNRPRVPWPDTVLYELHVRGFTRLHPALPEHLRGTYAGLAHPAVVAHLRGLGITAVELLPVHAHVSETALLERGLTNYWGYNTLGYFAPHTGYAATNDPITEFRSMVAALHEAGIEVILDVVYNHTADGSEHGPTLSLRGLGNAAYYRLEPTDARRYSDVTGCGNTVDATSPHVVRLICDSLRYWVTTMGVDGFRFDLATALARNPDGFDPAAPLLTTIYADPILRSVKLIAEPWDVGWGGYQVGGFPVPWAEWNDRFRDTLRDIFNGHTGGVADLGYRLTGSSDLYDHAGRKPWASINFVTAHDGFPLADLVSYDRKHNAANGENNRDGDSRNRSCNYGAEGPTDDPAILAVRRRVRRALAATLLLSAGVPMLLAGDEFGRSQGGNNNAYCQDNPISWLGWPAEVSPPAEGNRAVQTAPAPDPAGPDPLLPRLISGLIELRSSMPTLRRRRFFHGGVPTSTRLPDISWFRPDGIVMSPADWNAPHVATLVAHLAGESLGWTDPDGRPERGESLLLVVHPDGKDVSVTLPGKPWSNGYDLLLDTSADDLAGFPDSLRSTPPSWIVGGATLRVGGRSVLVLRAHPPRAHPPHAATDW